MLTDAEKRVLGYNMTPQEWRDHLGGAHLEAPDMNIYMPTIFQYLIDKHGVKSMVDVGCGGGWTAKWFLDNGCRAFGVEGDQGALSKNQLPWSKLFEHDYNNGPLIVPSSDLAWAGEFVEHVDEQYVPNFVATFACCRLLAMTHGVPFQVGFHHVNCREDAYWEETLANYGFLYDKEETMHLRSLKAISGGWGIQTLMFFKNAWWNKDDLRAA